jgi:hypothetical protein
VLKFALLIFCIFPTIITYAQETASSGDEIRIIDIHAHIGSFEGFDVSTETLLQNMRRHNIRFALISNIDGAELSETRNLNEVETNQLTLETLRANPNSLRGLAWARPGDGSPENLEPFLRDHRFVGVKLHPEMNHFAADDSLADGYLVLCAKYGVPAVFHSGKTGSNSDPRKIYRAAQQHPTVPVILYHMGFKGPHDEAMAVVKQSIEKRDAQLYLETAQVDPQSVLAAVQQLGAERVLFGTDATYYGKAHYERYLPMIELLRQQLSEDDYGKVMWGNALSLFKLEDK